MTALPDAVTLDQLRAFLFVVEEGSFSGAARRLGRVQSAVSHAMATLEAQLGVVLWDRRTRKPTLTTLGKALYPDAERVIADADQLRQRAAELVSGLEPTVALCVDSVFPSSALVQLCRRFASQFPMVQLSLYTETLQAVAERVLDGTCDLGVVGPAARTEGLVRTYLATVPMVAVAAATHPLARRRGPLSATVLAGAIQIVLGERGAADTPNQGVLSSRTFRVADLGTKRELLLAGLGWGNLPEHLARADLRRGRLRRLRPAAWGPHEHDLALSLVERARHGSGPARRWVVSQLGALCMQETSPR